MVGRVKSVARLLHAADGVIVANAMSMLGAMVITSGLGAAYWLLAAHMFTGAAVGLAAASISAMTLLGNAGMLGLGTLLIGELPRQRGEEGRLISTALLAAGIAGTALGLLFALAAPVISPNLGPLAAGIAEVVLFALGVCLTSVTAVLDQGLIGLLRGSLQFSRNAVFAVTKLGALLAAGTWLVQQPELRHESWLTIYATWLFGNLVSLLVLTAIAMAKGARFRTHGSQSRRYLLRRFAIIALGHHWLNLALQVPGFALPLVVTALLSSTDNAYFYVASMIAGLVFYGPLALVTALYAVGSGSPAALAQRMRFTLTLAVAGGLIADAVLFVGADHVLQLFGASYAAKADWTLRILGLGVFPVIIKDHFVAVSRIRGRVMGTALLASAGSVLELGMAAIGGVESGSLLGLTIGWLTALTIEALLMAPSVYRAARQADQTVSNRPEGYALGNLGAGAGTE